MQKLQLYIEGSQVELFEFERYNSCRKHSEY